MFRIAASGYGMFREKANLTQEAQAVADQLELFEQFPNEAQNILARWVGPQKKTGSDAAPGIDDGGGTPPGGAAFANLQAMSVIAELLWNYSRTRMEKGFSRQDLKKVFDDTLTRSLPKNESEKIAGKINQKLSQTKAQLTEQELDDFMMHKVNGELRKSLNSEKAWNLYMALKGAAVGTLYNDCKLDSGHIRTIANQLAQASLNDPSNVDVLQNLALLFNYLGDTDRKTLAESLAAQYGGTK
jgi:hypothetical protein